MMKAVCNREVLYKCNALGYVYRWGEECWKEIMKQIWIHRKFSAGKESNPLLNQMHSGDHLDILYKWWTHAYVEGQGSLLNILSCSVPEYSLILCGKASTCQPVWASLLSTFSEHNFTLFPTLLPLCWLLVLFFF